MRYIYAIQMVCRTTYERCQSSDLLWQQLAHAYAPFGLWELAAQRSPYLSQPYLRWYDELRRFATFQKVAKWSLDQFIQFWIAQEQTYEKSRIGQKVSSSTKSSPPVIPSQSV